MDNHSAGPALPMLSSNDLEEIDRFHTAWCEENNVEKNDARAVEVASALIDWYSTSPAYRLLTKLDRPPALPISPKIDTLLDRLGQLS